MAEMSWKDAAQKVLEGAHRPLHYREIADEILAQGLKTTFGATPESSVNAVISTEIQREGSDCVFERVSPGVYGIKASGRNIVPLGNEPESGSLEAFGVYWRRDQVKWTGEPRLFGRARPRADRVNLADQRGVYLLYDEHRAVVYVGQATKQSIWKRVGQHVDDRLTARWERFSWFGIRPVEPSGSLASVETGTISPERLILTLEALLIEVLEPRQNRAGSSYSGEEYIQAPDPRM